MDKFSSMLFFGFLACAAGRYASLQKQKNMEYVKISLGGDDIRIPVPRSYRDCAVLIRSDYYRYTGQKGSLWRIWAYGLRNPSQRFSFWLRMAAYRKGWLYPVAKFNCWRLSKRYGLQIFPQTLIGYGLYIGHAFGTIVNPSAVIGNNVNLSQFTTIGSNKGCAAYIGDNVYVGPSVCIVEHVCIGSNATIGAGAVVVKDIPGNATAAGVPAKVISTSNPGRFVNRRWPVEDVSDGPENS